MDESEIPEWASDRHIVNGGEHYCAHCIRHRDELVGIEVDKVVRMATWMGVNWEDGVEERISCPECESSGHIRTKLMSKHIERTRFVKDGAAAFEDALAEADRKALGDPA